MNNENINQETEALNKFFTASTVVEEECVESPYAGLEHHPEIFCG